MHNLGFALDGAWRVLAAGLVLGAGLPVVFALGIRAMAAGDATVTERPSPAARPLGVLCFVVVLLGVALGITFVVATGFGKQMSFEHIYPVLVDKH
jgi:hypothetical protein